MKIKENYNRVTNSKPSTPPRKNGAGCYKRGGFGF
jgi:hypothetical protein